MLVDDGRETVARPGGPQHDILSELPTSTSFRLEPAYNSCGGADEPVVQINSDPLVRSLTWSAATSPGVVDVGPSSS